MSLLSTLKSFTTPRELFARSQNGALGHALVARSLDLDVLVPDPLQNGVVAACVNAVAKALPDAPLLLENRTSDGWQEVPDHECLRVLRAPNADHSDADVWGLTSGYKATRGQAFWLLLPDKLGRVGEIHVWNPDMVTVLGDESQFISGYRIRRENGTAFEVSRSGVIHFRHLPDFSNPRLGWNPLRTGRAQIAGDNIGASYHTSILHNAGVVSLLISLKEGAATGQVTPEQFQQVLTNIRRASRERSGGVEGINLPLEVHKLAYSPDEMNVDKLIEYYETRICSVMGVSQRVAGLGSDPTYNNLSEALSDFWERRIVPDRNADAATLNRQWLPLFGLDDGNWRFRFDYSGVPALQENRDALHARVRADFEKGLMDKKQARALLGYGTSSDEAFAGVFYGDKLKTSTDADGSFKGIWNEADHPRNLYGQFESGGDGGASPRNSAPGTSKGEVSAEDHLHGLMSVNSNLSPEHLKAYSESMSHVVKRIPSTIHPHLVRRIRKIEAFNSLESLRLFGSTHWGLAPTTLGGWNGKEGAMLLDGEETGQSGMKAMTREQIYAHELTHAVDSVEFRQTGKLISDSPEWLAAYKTEKDNFFRISFQARDSPKEAFAELGRLFYSSNDSGKVIAKYKDALPECLKIWKRKGLIP